MNIRNAIYTNDSRTSVDVEIEHPEYGWMPYTFLSDQPDESFDAEIREYLKTNTIAPKALPPLPTSEELEAEAKAEVTRLKLQGILFQGVMCSATAEDMWGLTSVLVGLNNFDVSYNFRFDNGNILVINRSNYMELMAVWAPFRDTFF